jgi:hypothetical protein
MKKLVAPLFALLAFCSLATPAFADDPKTAFLGYMRSVYNPHSLRDVAQYMPERLATAMNTANNPEGEKQSLEAYKARYLGNVKFDFDQAADPSTVQLSGSGIGRNGCPTSFQVTMMKEKVAWKVGEWAYQPDPNWVREHSRPHPR